MATSRSVKRAVVLLLSACLLLGCFLFAQQFGGPVKEKTSAETYYDFRGSPLPPSLFVFGDSSFLRVEPHGLRMTLPKGRKDAEAIVIATGSDAFDTAGDFEITTTLEILHAETPPPSYGVGVSLVVKKSPPSSGEAAVCRLVRAQNRQIVVWDQTFEVAEAGKKRKSVSGEIPCTDKVLRLRLKRTGTTLHHLWAPGLHEDTFQEIHQCEFGDDAIGRIVVGGVTGRKPCALDARSVDLRILTTRNAAVDAAAAPLGRWSVWLALALVSVLFIATGVALVRQRRLHRRPTAAPKPAAEAESAS